MPYKQVSVSAELFLEVGSVKLYYTYKNDNVYEGVHPFKLTLNPEEGEFDRTDYDIRELLKERIESGRFPNKYVTLFGDEDEIREGLRAAILAGEITFPEVSEESEIEQPANRGDAKPVSLGSLLRQKLAMMESEGLIQPEVKLVPPEPAGGRTPPLAEAVPEQLPEDVDKAGFQKLISETRVRSEISAAESWRSIIDTLKTHGTGLPSSQLDPRLLSLTPGPKGLIELCDIFGLEAGKKALEERLKDRPVEEGGEEVGYAIVQGSHRTPDVQGRKTIFEDTPVLTQQQVKTLAHPDAPYFKEGAPHIVDIRSDFSLNHPDTSDYKAVPLGLDVSSDGRETGD